MPSILSIAALWILAVGPYAHVPDSEARRIPEMALTDGDATFRGQLVVTHDGRRVIAAGVDGKVRVWSLRTGELLHRLDERPRRV